MTFIEKLLEGGGRYIIEERGGLISVKPQRASSTSLEQFQAVVRLIEQNEGEGFRIFKRHESSDHTADLTTLLLLEQTK
ncbi:MAG: hypothetical protein AAF291_13945 [Pseudomonadota bacterium]